MYDTSPCCIQLSLPLARTGLVLLAGHHARLLLDDTLLIQADLLLMSNDTLHVELLDAEREHYPATGTGTATTTSAPGRSASATTGLSDEQLLVLGRAQAASRIVQQFEEARSLLSITLLDTSTSTSHPMRIDVRWSYGTLKQHIGTLLHMDMFRVRIAANELKDTHKRLSEYKMEEGMVLTVERGAPMEPGQRSFKVSTSMS